LLEAQQQQEIPDPRRLVEDLPMEFYNILLTATQKDPDERYRNIWELLHAFRLLAEKIGMKNRSGKLEQKQMKGLLLFYHDELRIKVDELVDDLSRKTARIGASLRTIDLQDK
jgi:hypothetical protein